MLRVVVAETTTHMILSSAFPTPNHIKWDCKTEFHIMKMRNDPLLLTDLTYVGPTFVLCMIKSAHITVTPP